MKLDENKYRRICAFLGFNSDLNHEKIYNYYHNLRFCYYPNTYHFTIQNSLHKFYNKHFLNIDGNHMDFTLRQFYTVSHLLAEGILEVDMKDIVVGAKFEFGLNINSNPHNTFFLISKWQSYATTHINEFYTVPPFSGKPFQRTSYLSDYRVKAYDKSEQENISNSDILRYEIVITEIRKLKQILGCPYVSLATISTNESWGKLFDFVISTYCQIRKIPHVDLLKLSTKEIYSIHSYCNAVLRKDIQANNSIYKFNKLNIANRKIYEKYNSSSDNFFNELLKRIISKRSTIIDNI